MKNYSIHNNVLLRKGGRKIAKMSEKQFAEKVKQFVLTSCKDDSWTVNRVKETSSHEKIINCLPSVIRNIFYNDKKGTTTIVKDFKGIKPDWENFDITGGLRTVKGAPYIVMRVGGDWESPIAIFVYHDGKEFRCYIPKKGNAYRDDLKICFGNYDPDYDPNTKTYSDKIHSKKLKKDILSDDLYAFNALVKDGILDKDKDKDKLRGLGQYISYDIKQCIEDFTSRVEVKPLKESSLYNNIIKSISCAVYSSLNESLFDDDLFDDEEDDNTAISDVINDKIQQALSSLLKGKYVEDKNVIKMLSRPEHRYKVKDAQELGVIIRMLDKGWKDDTVPLNWVDISNVTDLSYKFMNTYKNYDISEWDVSHVKRFVCMFEHAYNFNCDISKWDMSSATLLGGMFEHARTFNQDISNWKLPNVQDMSKMFRYALSFNQPIQNWEIPNIDEVDFVLFLYGAEAFKQDLSAWNLTDSINTQHMITNSGIDRYDTIHLQPKVITPYDIAKLLLDNKTDHVNDIEVWCLTNSDGNTDQWVEITDIYIDPAAVGGFKYGDYDWDLKNVILGKGHYIDEDDEYEGAFDTDIISNIVFGELRGLYSKMKESIKQGNLDFLDSSKLPNDYI